MKCLIIGVFICAISLNCSYAKNLPSFIQRCKLADPERGKCVAQRAAKVVQYLSHRGIPEMKLSQIEPMLIPKLEVHAGNGTSTGFNAVFSDIAVYGVKDIQFKEYIFDLEKPYMSLELRIPSLYIEATYDFNGKVLLFELSSTGRAQGNLTDISSKTHHRKMSIITKNGKQYLNLGDDEIEYIKYVKGNLYFEKLFKDNEQLTEQVNKAINDNFEEIGSDLNPLIYEAIRLLILGIVKPVFDDFSIDELFE